MSYINPKRNINIDDSIFERHTEWEYSPDLTTKEFFVRLWQTSTSLDDLMRRVRGINIELAEKFGYHTHLNSKRPVAKRKIATARRAYRSRAQRMRDNGVPLKNIEDIDESSYDQLRILAKSLI